MLSYKTICIDLTALNNSWAKWVDNIISHVVRDSFLSYFFSGQIKPKSIRTFAGGSLLLIIYPLQLALRYLQHSLKDIVKCAHVLKTDYLYIIHTEISLFTINSFTAVRCGSHYKWVVFKFIFNWYFALFVYIFYVNVSKPRWWNPHCFR